MTEDGCPEPGILVAWWEGSLPRSERAGWEPHVAACRACQAELATLAALPHEASRRISWRLPAAAAAGLLLAAGAWVLMPRQGRTPPVRPDTPDIPPVAMALSASPGPFAASSLTEILAGACGEVLLSPGSEGHWEAGDLHLTRGTAWAEACGTPLRIFAEGLAGHVELTDGRIVLQRQGPKAISFWMASAWAGEGGWRIGVSEGEAYLVSGSERRRLEGMAGLPEDPRRWLRETSFRLRDAVHAFPVPGGAFVGEILLRKQALESGADVLFHAGGRGWRLPLGAHLPEGKGWIRLRLETGPGGIRFLAGGREVFKASTSGLPALLHDCGDAPAFGLKAWGGDVEVKEARWR